MEIRDWFVMAMMGATGLIASVALFLHFSAGAFVTWAGLQGTLIGAYHWFVIRDQKVPDA